MAIGNFTSNQGTQTPIAVDTLGGGSVMALQKLDISPLGASGTPWLGYAPDITTAGTLTGTQNLPINVNGLTSVGFQVINTFTGTLVAEASLDGGNTWNPTTIIQLSNGSILNSVNGPILAQINAAALGSVRIRANTISSGSAVVFLRAGQGASNIMLDNPLPAGANIIGNIGTINSATVTGNVGILTGTVNVGTFVANGGTVSVVQNAGTVQGGTINLATVTGNLGTIGTIGLATIAGNLGTIGTIGLATITGNAGMPSGTLNVGTINNATITTGSITITAGTISAGTIANNMLSGTLNLGTVRTDARTTQNIVSFGTQVAFTGAAAATIIGSASVGAGTSLWMNDMSLMNNQSGVGTFILGFGTAQQGTNVLFRGALGTSSAVGIEKTWPKLTNSGMTNQDLVLSATGAGTVDLSISYLISA